MVKNYSPTFYQNKVKTTKELTYVKKIDFYVILAKLVMCGPFILPYQNLASEKYKGALSIFSLSIPHDKDISNIALNSTVYLHIQPSECTFEIHRQLKFVRNSSMLILNTVDYYIQATKWQSIC